MVGYGRPQAVIRVNFLRQDSTRITKAARTPGHRRVGVSRVRVRVRESAAVRCLLVLTDFPVLYTRKEPAGPYVYFVCPFTKHICPTRAACWSPKHCETRKSVPYARAEYSQHATQNNRLYPGNRNSAKWLLDHVTVNFRTAQNFR